jgi:ribosome biogenesis GTPase
LQEAITLRRLGWSDELEDAFAEHGERGLVPGRIAVQHRGAYDVYTEAGELSARVAGRLRHEAAGPQDLPAAGDWVALDAAAAVIHAMLPRRTKISRKTAWAETEEHVLAANVDVVLVLTALTGDLNLRRLERYLTTVWESGAMPAVVLTKTDLVPDFEAAMLAAESVAIGVPVHAVSSVTGVGVEEILAYTAGNRTIALLGSSGVGKSTLLNRLVGEDLLPVQEVAADGRGRHTTTRRELVLLPGEGLVLDTPGMRELQLWDAGEGFGAAFEDVEALASGCRFNDCSHTREPGCAVLGAVDEGRLELDRLRSWRKLQRELAALARKQDQRLRSEERRKYRLRTKSFRKASW